MTFREKSAWICLMSIMLVLGPYFFHVWRLFDASAVSAASVWAAFGLAVVAQTGLSIAAHILLARNAGREPKDERDTAIETASFRHAYRVLSIGMVALLIVSTWFASFSMVAMGQLLLLGFVAAELTRYASQVWGYRRGVRA